MAYYRPSLLPPSQTSQMMNFNSTIQMSDMETDIQMKSYEKRRENDKQLIIFSIDISLWSPWLQYVTLAGGLILFMCLYGYFQELVVYGWFNRKLSMFSTFLHFLGCSIFAQFQRDLTSRNKSTHHANNTMLNHQNAFMSMGNAPARTAVFYYILLVLTKTASQGLSNLSMTQINYPAKTLFKSANPIMTIIIGVIWFKKSYPMKDYVGVLLLVLGLCVFITGSSNSSTGTESPKSTSLGICYVVLSMIGSAGVPMIQEYCINIYNASIEDLLYHSFIGSTIVSLLFSILNGEFINGIIFLLSNGSIHTWTVFIAFTTFGFIGSNFSTALTYQYGSLVNGITNTVRKALTLALSFLMFPERNVLTAQNIVGAFIFFAGLLVKTLYKSSKGPLHGMKESSPIGEGRSRTLSNIEAVSSSAAYFLEDHAVGSGDSAIAKQLDHLSDVVSVPANIVSIDFEEVEETAANAVFVDNNLPTSNHNDLEDLRLDSNGYHFFHDKKPTNSALHKPPERNGGNGRNNVFNRLYDNIHISQDKQPIEYFPDKKIFNHHSEFRNVLRI